MKYIISACLVGVPCRYNGSCRDIKELHEIVDNGDAIFLCPEIMDQSIYWWGYAYILVKRYRKNGISTTPL